MKNKVFLAVLIFAVLAIFSSCSIEAYQYTLRSDISVYFSDDSEITSCSADELGLYETLSYTHSYSRGSYFPIDVHYYFRLPGSEPYDYVELNTKVKTRGDTVFRVSKNSSGKIVINKTYE